MLSLLKNIFHQFVLWLAGSNVGPSNWDSIKLHLWSTITLSVSYLDQVILSPIVSITVFPMAMCLYEVWLLLALAVLLDCSLLQLKKEDSGYLTGIIWSQLIEIES